MRHTSGFLPIAVTLSEQRPHLTPFDRHVKIAARDGHVCMPSLIPPLGQRPAASDNKFTFRPAPIPSSSPANTLSTSMLSTTSQYLHSAGISRPVPSTSHSPPYFAS